MTETEPANVTIGILTALEDEYNACCGVFDPDNKGAIQSHSTALGVLICKICSVAATSSSGNHGVAISLLGDMGNVAASIAVGRLRERYHSLRYVIMCGIAGAVPYPTNPQEHVRLGDIVVSDKPGIIQYDRGKQRDPQLTKNGSTDHDDPFAGFEFRGFPVPPSPDLLTVVRHISAEEKRLRPDQPREWELKIESFLLKNEHQTKWQRPPNTEDILIDSPSDQTQIIPHPEDKMRRENKPRIFCGPIGASDIVQADPLRRNSLRDRFHVKAIEMEGHGIATASWETNIGYLVVRGTCDYCNSKKNDDWRHYAALIAAAYTHTVIEELPVSEVLGLLVSDVRDAGAISANLDAPQPASYSGISLPTHSETKKPLKETESHIYAISAATPPETPTTIELSEIALAQELLNSETIAVDNPISTIVSEMDSLFNEYEWSKAESLAGKLESLLKRSSSCGKHIRAGWLILAQIEARRLIEQRLACHSIIDVSRLTSLRRRAEDVTG